ncbi:MAG: DEAD/DEAH box helicase, partial [Micromonosporaceae bacterium]
RLQAGAGRRRGRRERRAMSELATALRAGRRRRRQLLAQLNPKALLRALPLWIGTVGDVEELLPAVAGGFDLVILDEASHINQIGAAPVLARARRAVVAGDPRQLRFVSFVGDRQIDEVLARHGLAERAPLLDVRRNSAFDVAAAAAAVTRLSEHYRSVPHLIAFSSARFYGGTVSTVTRHPRNDSLDAIELHPVDPADSGKNGNGGTSAGGKRGNGGKGANQAEVAAALALVDRYVSAGADDLAVITPYRAQADAIEAALINTYAERLGRLRLRAGTVHAFQGSEADVVIASLAVRPGDDAGRVRFATDPHLFNVMITRARRTLHVLTSWPDAGGLLGDFFRYADKPPTPPETEPGDAWTQRLAAELRRAGAPVTTGYPVGRWSVDLCVGAGGDAFGVMCQVHPDGVAAHLARHRILRHAGWQLTDVFSAPGEADPSRLVVELLGRWRA